MLFQDLCLLISEYSSDFTNNKSHSSKSKKSNHSTISYVSNPTSNSYKRYNKKTENPVTFH